MGRVTLFFLFFPPPFSEFAISPNNNEVHIYTKSGGKWELEHKLMEHTSRVTGMDWAPKGGSLVTCAAVSTFSYFYEYFKD